MAAASKQYTVALVTDTDGPALSVSDQTLLAPLRERGIHAHAVPWEARGVDWRAFDLVVLRSCWNYHRYPAVFRSWIDELDAAGAHVCNRSHVVRWNVDKRYLRELKENGVPVVPTVWLERGERAQLGELLDAQGWHHAVVKPRVGASAYGIWPVERAVAAGQQVKLDRMLAAGGALVQPLMPEIAGGEWSFVFFDGAYSHAALKVPAPGDIFVQRRLGGTTCLGQPDRNLIEQATVVLHAATALTSGAPTGLLYARVDGLEVNGRLVLMELELIEPGLFLDLAAPEAPARFAAAIAGRLDHHTP